MPDVILSNLAAATTPLAGTERIPMDQRVGGTIAATALTPGLGYAIVSVGTTNWVTCGVPAGVTPVVGLVFTCQAVGTGTGTAQQVETVDAAASDVAALALTNLTDLTVPGTLTAAHIHGAMAGPLYIHVRNDSGTTLAAGATVHVVNNQGDTDRMLVVLARADDPATLPANGVLLAALAPNADGHAVVVGEATGMNTAGLTAGAQVFVAPAGGLTLTRPATNPQSIATVGRVHASTGSLLVNASPVLSSVAFSGAYGDLSGRPPLGTAAPLDVASTGNASAAQVVKGDDTRLRFAVSSTYTASGPISTTDRLALINATSAVTMTLAAGSSDGHMLLIKRIGSGSVTVTASLDGSSSSIVADSPTIKESVLLAWSSSLSTWLIL